MVTLSYNNETSDSLPLIARDLSAINSGSDDTSDPVEEEPVEEEPVEEEPVEEEPVDEEPVEEEPVEEEPVDPREADFLEWVDNYEVSGIPEDRCGAGINEEWIYDSEGYSY